MVDEEHQEEHHQETGTVMFEDQFPVRYRWYQGKMYYSLIDVVAALTGTDNPNRYWSDLKRKLIAEGYDQIYEKIVRLKMRAPDNKLRLTDAVDRETVFRIVQSLSTVKAEPFKLFLAQAGDQVIQEFDDPEISIEKAREAFRLKGMPEEWIEKRIQSILVRNELTQEWDERGAQKQDYGILTDTIAKGTFHLTTQEHKQRKGLKRENLRDHMTNMELVLTMLGEVTTTELHRDRESQGVPELQRDAKDGGAVAGRARQDIERQLGTPVVSNQNYLAPPKRSLQKKRKELPPSLFPEQGQDNNALTEEC